MIGLKDKADVVAPYAVNCSGASPAVARPQTRTNPIFGDSMQPSTDNSVVLPLPEGPISSTSSPPLSDRLTPRSACTFPAPWPRNLTTSVACTTGSLIG